MTDFICWVAIVVFSALSVLAISVALFYIMYLLYLPWGKWANRGVDKAFYWILDTLMGNHTCQKGKDDEN